MTGTVGGLILAALAFLAIHIVPSSVLRERVVSGIGEKAYMAGFSLLSALILAWLIYAYNVAPAGDILYDAGNVGRYIALLLMLIASVLFFGAVTSPNPTAIGAGKMLDKESAYRGINAITRHPMMWSFTLWSIAHIVNNGDIISIVFFGTFGLLAFAGTFLIDAKKARQLGEDWTPYEARTSNIPFAAIIQGRASLSIKPLWWRILAGVVLFAALYLLHPLAFGVSPGPI